jgi:superfamily II DNA or RNA helicase
MFVQRFSSRRQDLSRTFLAERLHGAKAYDRIAGYFRSSLFAVVGDVLDSITGPIRVVCNSDLNVEDVETAQAAKNAIRQEWCLSDPIVRYANNKPQLIRLYDLLSSGKMKVRVLPRQTFGLEHGKAGIITFSDGRKTAFMGSANESLNGWKVNYELVWEDSSPEAVQWVQEEFDYLWSHSMAVPLSDFVIEDIARIAHRTVVPTVAIWRENPEAAAAVIESPVYRKEYGLWEHQKYFVDKAFKAHLTPYGARFVLADMVGLGKTVQLALSALLMALTGDGPVLIIVPKSLMWQWQAEMKILLDMPSAVWNGKQWVDENEIDYPAIGPGGIRRCPRRVGIISQSLITSKSDIVDILKQMTYECIIVDEAHRARRKNLGLDSVGEAAVPNNLLSFLNDISSRTKSFLLATATPVQLYPIEAWDLLKILAGGNELVLGNDYSYWRKPDMALSVVMGKSALPIDDSELWRWIRNPLPPSTEGRDFANIRDTLKMDDDVAVAKGDTWEKLKESDKKRVRQQGRNFGVEHNPFIRHIVRRTREYLETTKDPETGEPYLKPVKVDLRGEGKNDAIRLPAYLQDAYNRAEEFCDLLSERVNSSGFLKTLLLRRVGSSIQAGLVTAQKMLGNWQDIDEDEDIEETPVGDKLLFITAAERKKLQEFVDLLEASQERDPKYPVILDILIKDRWLEKGCIIFSQYYESISWLANQLTKELPNELIAIYAGGQKSGTIMNGEYRRVDRENIKQMVQRDEIRLLLGTDAASEGLNLQRLGSLINLDLPWNPTRLEQRKGRIQRIGQLQDIVYIYNMRYLGSVEDRVHDLLSKRLESIYQLFGQLPDVLKDVWIDVALKNDEKARQTIDAVPKQHPFEIRYHRIEKVPWESCSKVLDAINRKQHLTRGW